MAAIGGAVAMAEKLQLLGLSNRNGVDVRWYMDNHQDGGTCGACTPNYLSEHRSDELHTTLSRMLQRPGKQGTL